MSATGNGKRLAVLALFLSFCLTIPAYSQTVPRQNLAELTARVSVTAWRSNCGADFSSMRASWRAPELEPDVFPTRLADDGHNFNLSPSREDCVGSRAGSSSAINRDVEAGTPCNNSSLRVGNSCAPADDSVAPRLDSLGRSGAEIRRARHEVLDILSSQNACTEWFATQDPAPNLTFETLGFILDHEGAADVLASAMTGSNTLIRQPYVARATQDGGPNTDITINAYGAFYRSQAKLESVSAEGGPVQFRGEHWLTVGSYSGNTLQAQVLTLLHELGHVINLLPEDSDDLDGKSARNTGEVLRHCRGEIESRAKRGRETAGK